MGFSSIDVGSKVCIHRIPNVGTSYKQCEATYDTGDSLVLGVDFITVPWLAYIACPGKPVCIVKLPTDVLMAWPIDGS